MRVKRNSVSEKDVRGRRGSAIVSKDKLLQTTIFPTCLHCGTSKMSSIPMGAHAALKVRQNLSHGAGFEKHQPSMSFSNASDVAPQPTPPVRYNSKLMNSVWGMYNRYSVHNMKSHIAYTKN